MKNPNPVNLTTPEKSRSLGWAAETRDEDGHLLSQHAPFQSDADLVHYVREAMGEGLTITIWPHEIEEDTVLTSPFA